MSYYRVASIGEVPPGSGIKVRLGRDEIALFHVGGVGGVGGEFYAINDLCPHRGAPLSEGFLEQGKVFCPWHCFDFHLQTGESSVASHLRVATYPVKVEGDDILLLYPDELLAKRIDGEDIDDV